MIETARRVATLVTILAGVITAALGAHKIIDIYSDGGPAYRMITASVVIGLQNSESSVDLQMEKVRKECAFEKAAVEVRMKAGHDVSSPLDIGASLTPGPHKIKGRFDGPNIWDIDLQKRPKVSVFHRCEDGGPLVLSLCIGYFAGAKKQDCHEE